MELAFDIDEVEMRFLAGDIGGTKTLLALFSVKRGKLVLERKEKYQSGEYQSLEEILAQFLTEEKRKISKACFGIAGPIKNGVCQATNLPWTIRGKSLAHKFSLGEVFLINDLEANAYGLMTLKKKDFYCLQKGKKESAANKALISAGTGLGEAPIFFTGSLFLPSPSEGGHADFAPRNHLEIELLEYLWEEHPHVSIERVLSGQGIVHLYNFLLAKGYEKPSLEVQEAFKGEDPAKVISSFALEGGCPACKRAVEWFCSLYGGEAGNFALKVMSLGGLYIGGGIAPKILPLLKESSFVEDFCNKGRFRNLLKSIPIYVVLEESTALRGAAFFCKNEKKFCRYKKNHN